MTVSCKQTFVIKKSERSLEKSLRWIYSKLGWAYSKCILLKHGAIEGVIVPVPDMTPWVLCVLVSLSINFSN